MKSVVTVLCGLICVARACGNDTWSDEQRAVLASVGESELQRVLTAGILAEKRGRTKEEKDIARRDQQEWLTGRNCPGMDGLSSEQRETLGVVRVQTDDRWTVISVPSDHEVLMMAPGRDGKRLWIDTVRPHGATTDGDFVVNGLARPLREKEYLTVVGTRDHVLAMQMVPTEALEAVWRERISQPDWPEVRDRIVAEARRQVAKAVRRR